jgi:hypothetical protein
MPTMIEATSHLQAIPASATPEEAAAIVAAIERFVRDTAPAPATLHSAAPEGWRSAALIEGVSRDPWVDGPQPW